MQFLRANGFLGNLRYKSSSVIYRIRHVSTPSIVYTKYNIYACMICTNFVNMIYITTAVVKTTLKYYVQQLLWAPPFRVLIWSLFVKYLIFVFGSSEGSAWAIHFMTPLILGVLVYILYITSSKMWDLTATAARKVLLYSGVASTAVLWYLKLHSV